MLQESDFTTETRSHGDTEKKLSQRLDRSLAWIDAGGTQIFFNVRRSV